MRLYSPFQALMAAAVLASPAPSSGGGDVLDSPRKVAAVRDYIHRAWTVLTRSNRSLAAAAKDPKFPRPADGKWPVYVSQREDKGRVAAELARAMGDDFRKISLETLPANPQSLREPGLLYLPYPYVVPGGRFNEMYGWDSYFIQLGLLRDGQLDLARHMADNFLYEIENYGTILNANRTYYMTRSQPPFLTQMVLGVFRRSGDKAWLSRSLPAITAYYRYWTTGPHAVPGTALSRYWDSGEGPAPEVVSAEHGAGGLSHYDRVRLYYREHPNEVDGYDVARVYDRAHDRLTDLYYRGDRSMRESGFDPSGRFGTFNADVVAYAPVCLNTLLYRMELDVAEIEETLGDAGDAPVWRRRAETRLRDIDRYLWDDEAGLYLDFNFETRTRRRYPFATTFWPLWAGAASPQRARRVHANLGMFEAPGGLRTSTKVTGDQWDAPYGWAPLQLLAVEGLRRYGYVEDADRIARSFVRMIVEDFDKHGVIVEKYDVDRRASDVGRGLRFGYSSNEVGFGWTNAVFEELWADIEADAGGKDGKVSSSSGRPSPSNQ